MWGILIPNVRKVFSHMQPRDLLNLARTSKPFRELLMSRQSASFWRGARKNVPGLPNCPPYMSEPAYANLCFFSHCHECLRPNVKAVHWEFRARLISERAAEPIQSVDGQGNVVTVPMLVERHRRMLYSLNANEREEWADVVAGKNAEIMHHASLCKEWMFAQQRERQIERVNLREARFHGGFSIVDRLRDLGWEDELLDGGFLWALKDFRPVRSFKQLTDTDWSRIQRPVLEFCKDRRRKRMESRLQSLQLVVEWSWNGSTDWKPSLGQLALLPEIRTIIESPYSYQISSLSFVNLGTSLRELEQKCDRYIYDRLRELIRTRQTHLDIPPDIDPLGLAVTTFFSCARCKVSLLTLAEIRVHPCCLLGGSSDGDEYKSMLHSLPQFRNMWDGDCLSFDFGPAAAIIRQFEEDPATVSALTMDASCARLTVQSSYMNSHITTMSWRAAIVHIVKSHPELNDDSHAPWYLSHPSENLAPEISRLEQEAYLRASPEINEHCLWYCAICSLWCARSKRSAEQHCSLLHFGYLSRVDSFIYPDPDSPLACAPVHLSD
ncbi:hypothetical protein K474DRAFT_1677692 [Panus rudis PR-1116 ss-1]|nr:hypothetical protein K474DRAFT_1677692 [Panus rudis PR-1116 ss-1]